HVTGNRSVISKDRILHRGLPGFHGLEETPQMVGEVVVIGREDVGFTALNRLGGSRLRIVLLVPRFLIGVPHLLWIARTVIAGCVILAVLLRHRHLDAVVADFYDPSRAEEAGGAFSMSALCHQNSNAQVWIIIERAHHVGEFASVFPA